MQTIPSPTAPGFRLTPQAVLGVLIVGLGLLLTADNFNLVEADQVLRFWPLVFVAVGLTKLVQSDTTAGQVFGGVLAVTGVSMIVDEFWAIDLEIDRMWPLALVAVRSIGKGIMSGWVIAMTKSTAEKSRSRPVASKTSVAVEGPVLVD